MAKYLLKSCCCGCRSLRTGTIISGVAAILLAIIGIIIVLVVKVELKTIVFDFLDKTIVLIIVIVNMSMAIILSIIMLVGVVKRKWVLMAPWIALGGLLSVGLLVSIIINSIYFYNKELEDGTKDTLNGTLWLVVGLPALVIYCYMWYVCFSFFSNLVDETRRGAYTKDPFRRQRM